MNQWETLKSKLKEEYGITPEKEMYSTHSRIEGGTCTTENFGYSFNYVVKRYPGNPTYVERYKKSAQRPTYLTHLIGNDINSIVSTTTGFFGKDGTGKKAWYEVEFFYRDNNPNNITITRLTPRLEDLDNLVQIEYSNNCPVYAAFQKGDKLIVHSFIGKSKTFEMPGNKVIELETFSDQKPGIDETDYIFFSFDDNNIYLNHIEGTLYTQLNDSGYKVSFNSSKIFTSKNTTAGITKIEPIYHNDDGCVWYTFHYTDKFTIIITYSDGQKQLLVINNIASPKQQVFRSKLYDDIKHIRGNFHSKFDTNGQPIEIEYGLTYEFTNNGKKEYHFIPDNGKHKGKRRVYKRKQQIVPAPKEDTEDTE